jgi:hypothetical protein
LGREESTGSGQGACAPDAPRLFQGESREESGGVFASLCSVSISLSSILSEDLGCLLIGVAHRHNWSDDYCIQILTEIRKAMGPGSKLLIADQVMNTTLGDPELPSAPTPLLANYGTYIRFSHQINIAMMATINGVERTRPQFQHIIEEAGLRINRIQDARTQVSVIECVKVV